jgi:ribulose-phosphate 3-epimerase
MDGCLVPNLTFGLPILEALRKLTTLPLDVHLMIVEPQRYIEPFSAAGADCLTVHVEAVADPRPVLQQLRDLGVASGIALNPATDIHRLDGCLDLCDLVLVMSVPAGFGGQEFDEIALDKLRYVRSLVGPDVLLEVDGGVNTSTIRSCVLAGAELLVAGSAVFQHENYGTAMHVLRRVATGAS